MLAWSPWDLVLPCPSICTSALQNDDFDILMKKIRDGVAENPNIDKALELYDDVQGCFIDIDYARRDRTNWMPLIHVDRLYDFVFAYTHPKNSYYQNEDLYHKIVKGLEYWHHRNPHCNNWWYNQIGIPKSDCGAAETRYSAYSDACW